MFQKQSPKDFSYIHFYPNYPLIQFYIKNNHSFANIWILSCILIQTFRAHIFVHWSHFCGPFEGPR